MRGCRDFACFQLRITSVFVMMGIFISASLAVPRTDSPVSGDSQGSTPVPADSPLPEFKPEEVGYLLSLTHSSNRTQTQV